jgi:hypothetical protein
MIRDAIVSGKLLRRNQRCSRCCRCSQRTAFAADLREPLRAIPAEDWCMTKTEDLGVWQDDHAEEDLEERAESPRGSGQAVTVCVPLSS